MTLPLLTVPRLTTDFARRSFSYAAPVTWNSLPANITLSDSEQTFHAYGYTPRLLRCSAVKSGKRRPPRISPYYTLGERWDLGLLGNMTLCSTVIEHSSVASFAEAATSHYTPSPEKGATLFLPVTLRNANRFSKWFTITLCSNFAVTNQ